MIMGHLAEQEKTGCSFYVWLSCAAELIEVKYLEEYEWFW